MVLTDDSMITADYIEVLARGRGNSRKRRHRTSQIFQMRTDEDESWGMDPCERRKIKDRVGWQSILVSFNKYAI